MPLQQSFMARPCVLIALGLLIGAAAPAHEPLTPLSVYGRLPGLENVVISPNGKRLALVRTVQETRNLVIMPLDGSKLKGGVKVGDSKLRDVMWQDNDHILVQVSTTSPPPIDFTGPRQEWINLVRFDLTNNKLNMVDFAVRGELSFNVVRGRTMVREVGNKSGFYVPGLYVGSDSALPGLFGFEDGFNARLMVKGNQPDTQWLVDEDGRPAVQLEYQDTKKTWTLKAHHDNHWIDIGSGTADIDSPVLLGFDHTGEQVILSLGEKNEGVWRPVSLKDGSIGPKLDREGKYTALVLDPRNDRVVGESNDEQATFFDNELQAHWNAVLREYPNETVQLVSHTADFSRMVLRVFGAKDGYIYALYDWYSHQAVRIGDVYDGVQKIAEVRPITYKAADGMSIPAFLTLPPGMEPKNLPLIVMPHGGPDYHDSLRFDFWAQALADQGYAVLQPNYRGSNVTVNLREAGFGEFGRKMQTDLSDGVRSLATDGLIDPKRVCIVGASYGGYAALAGVTLQRGIYRCAVSVAGLSDLHRMRNEVNRDDYASTTRYWDRYWGVTDSNEGQLLREISPINHVQSVDVPILLIHGKDDTVVSFEQSDNMLSALKKAGKTTDLVTLKHEDHWLSKSDTREQMLEATVAFLRTNNPPD